MSRSILPVMSWASALIAALVGFGGTIELIIAAMRTLGAKRASRASALGCHILNGSRVNLGCF